MPDASLMPTIVGGLLAIGGAVIGATGSAIVFLFQSRAEKKKRREEKFQELVVAVYEHDHWIDNLRRIYVVNFEGEIKVSLLQRYTLLQTSTFHSSRGQS